MPTLTLIVAEPFWRVVITPLEVTVAIFLFEVVNVTLFEPLFLTPRVNLEPAIADFLVKVSEGAFVAG